MARELAPAGLRSRPKSCNRGLSDSLGAEVFTTAAQPSGSKLPRHNIRVTTDFLPAKKPHRCGFLCLRFL
ncbi:hypothetical protein DCO47_24830 [Pseudomonas sp. NDM]|nr:hypothetical protein DCO47_24830 [Pseudomonas sp. NDM]